MLKKGFTLIELLVVIAIIGIITSIGVVGFLTAQKQARDAARREIISNAQSAFELEYAAEGAYPADATAIAAAFDDNIIPLDPKESGEYIISWDTSATDYCVCAKLEAGIGNSTGLSCSSWSSNGTYYCAQNKQ